MSHIKLITNKNGHCRLCTEDDKAGNMVQCDDCDRWFHQHCVNLEQLPSKKERWICPKCTEQEVEKQKLTQELNMLKNPVTMGQFEQLIARLNIKNEPEQNHLSILVKRQAMMSLPRFSGTAKEWPRFKSAFESTTDEGEFSNVENLNRLQQALEGNALKAVSHFMFEPENVPKIMERLEENFGRSNQIYEEYLNNLMKTQGNSNNSVVEISDALDAFVAHIGIMEKPEYLKDFRLIDEIVKKLPFNLQVQWIEVLQRNAESPTLKHLSEWLMRIAKLYRAVQVNTSQTKDKKVRNNVHHQQPDKERKQPFEKTTYNKRSENPTQGKRLPLTCGYCKSNHTIFNCESFNAMNAAERRQVVKEKTLCWSCLRPNHQSKNCPSARSCGIGTCKATHNRLLHTKNTPSIESSAKPTPIVETGSENVQSINHHQDSKTIKYFQILPVTLRNGDNIIKTYAFLDAGSSLTLLDEDTANGLGLEGRPETLKLLWTQDISKATNTKIVQLEINGINQKRFALKGVRTVKNLQLPMQSLDFGSMEKKYPYLKDLPIKNYSAAKPTILIGIKHSHLLVPLQTVIGGEHEPIALRTKLGWIMFGNAVSQIDNEYAMMIHQDDEMREMMKQHFSVEDFGVKIVNETVESVETERSKEILKNTLKRSGDRYEVGLLWKYDKSNFPDSYGNAYNRLLSLEKTLNKQNNVELLHWAKKTFKEYEDKGYIRKLTETEIENPGTDRVFYLPHFIVTNTNKIPPKPRLVFDAAAKIKGVSFNSELLSGPDATSSLFGVLLRWREGMVAVTGDIKEMFHQVKIRPEDQQAQRLLWRDCDPSKNPDTYVMQVMTFGSTCSPASAQAVKNTNAELYREIYPDAVDSIIDGHYVDDLLDSFNNAVTGIKVVRQITEIHDHAGFHIRNFASNSPELMDLIPENRRMVANVKSLDEKESNVEKVLGIYWNTLQDSIGYKLNINKLGEEVLKNIRAPTMREVLAFIMSIYDPLGLISNITIQGKILYQELHVASLKWDDCIPDQLLVPWRDWTDLIKSVENLSIPRCITTEAITELELHVFVDASEDAFAACIYSRSKTHYGFCIRLLAAKSRVSPIKPISIPRMELQGALLGTRLMNQVKEKLRVKITDITMWSDSQTVLAWIKTEKRKYHQFVGHRIGEILDSTTKDQWRWVPSGLNPADEGTKLVKGKSIWLDGPDFLRQPEDIWPAKSSHEPTTAEIVAFHNEPETYSFIRENDYSSWRRLVKGLIPLKKFVTWLQCKEALVKGMKYSEWKCIENALYRKAQNDAFPNEMEALISGKPFPKTSSILGFRPFLDEFGVMRCKGRLERANILPLATRIPIIMPQHHRLSKLLVRSYHEEYLHQEDGAVMTALHHKFWIINLKSVLKNVKNCCQKCILTRSKPIEPLMAPLPPPRVQGYVRPFTNCGVDYFGPYKVNITRNITDKRWGVLFTCMASRAVHIEMAPKLDTDSFLLCLRNLQNRRGKVAKLYSDNGTNFVGADAVLKSLVKEINAKMESGTAAEMEISWHFNPPGAPHFGGAWESLVKLAKQAIREMMDKWKENVLPKPESLQAAFIQAEFILNSRPLTDVPINCAEDEAITPFHILTGKGGKYVPPWMPTTTKDEKEQWKLVQFYQKYFWDRWKAEYIPRLLKRTKWQQKVKPIEVDDIVVLADQDGLPGSWLKGRIVKVFPGKDGQVRSADIQTQRGILTRRAGKIAVLDVSNKEPLLTTASKNLITHNEIEDNQPKRKLVDTTFPNWGKRIKHDEDEIKSRARSLNDSHRQTDQRKIRYTTPGTVTGVFVTAAALLSLTDALIVKPIESDGLVFDHHGTCVLKRGIWKTKLTTNLYPEEDISLLNEIHRNISKALESMEGMVKDYTLNQTIQTIGRHCDETIMDITQFSRPKRSKGIFGYIKDFIFGGDDVEEDIAAMRIHDDRLFHDISDTMAKINGKTAHMGEQFNDRIFRLHQDINRLHNDARFEMIETKTLETTILAREMIDEIGSKYRKLRQNPLPREVQQQLKQNISASLPSGYTTLDHELSNDIKFAMINGSLIIIVETIVVNKDLYELFNVYAVPNSVNFSQIIIDERSIAINHHKEYFYPKENDMVKLNATHLLITRATIKRKHDCISASIMHDITNIKCMTQIRSSPYSHLIQLSVSNKVLFYKSDNEKVVVHCNSVVSSVPYEAGIITIGPDCRIESAYSTIYGSISGESHKPITFFKPRAQLYYHIEKPHDANANVTSEIEPENPYLNDVITVVGTPEVIYRNSNTVIPLLVIIILGLIIGIYVYCKYFNNKVHASNITESQSNQDVNQRRSINLLPLPMVRYRNDPVVEEAV